MRDDCKLPLDHFHGFGKGEVVNEVLVRRRADVGMVDEDPMSSHHARRDAMELVSETNDTQLRRSKDRHVIVIKPNLEQCFLRSMKRVELESTLGERPQDLRARLNLPKHSAHKDFRRDLSTLYQVSRARKVATFIIELEEILRKLNE